MRYKYLKFYCGMVYGKIHITRDDLIEKKNGRIDVIVNTVEDTEFDSEKNEWVKINGDES